MFKVQTDCPIEKAQLQQQHPSIDKFFYVSGREVNTLIRMVRSILFEYFRGSPPALAKKLTDLLVSTMSMTLSLTLFRQILSLIKSSCSMINLYSDYFQAISHQMNDDEILFQSIPQETPGVSQILDNQDVRCSKFIYSNEFQEILDKENYNYSPIQTIAKRTALPDEVDTLLESYTTKKKDSIKKVLSCQHVISEEGSWWKKDNEQDRRNKQNNESRSIVSFEKKGQHLLKQDGIDDLLRRQEEEQDLMDSQYFTVRKKGADVNKLQFNQKMRQRLMTAKVKRRRKK